MPRDPSNPLAELNEGVISMRLQLARRTGSSVCLPCMLVQREAAVVTRHTLAD